MRFWNNGSSVEWGGHQATQTISLATVEARDAPSLLEAVIRTGDHICLEGDNRKQPDLLSSALSGVDVTKVNELHTVQSGAVLADHHDLLDRSIAKRLDCACSEPQPGRIAALLFGGKIELGAVRAYLRLFARHFIDFAKNGSLMLAVSAPVLWAGAAKSDDTAPPSYAQTTLTGDWGGVRNRLRDDGVTITITQTSDVLGNVSGGLETGAAYDGVLQLQGDFDMDRLTGWTGGNIHISGYAIQGQGLSAKDVGNFLTVTSVEANPGFRLGEFYVSQSLLSDTVVVKLGQILADQSFVSSNTASLFVNATFGWPGIFVEDLPGGGPQYPFAVPGAQIIIKPNNSWTLQAAAFNGSPTGSDPNGNANGLAFPLGDGVLFIVEAAYAYQPGKGDHGLPGTYKIGAWYDSESFDSLSEASNGVSLADPLSSGTPRQLLGDYAVYVVADQTLWQEPGSSDHGLNGFVRFAVAPQQDRNLVNWYVDGGLTYKGLLPGREDDTVGVSFAFANISSGKSDLVKAQNAFDGTSQPVPSSEAVIEATYQAALRPWFSVQPFFQYVIRPGGNATNPDNGSRIQNAAIFGLRVAANF
jgi:porin